jgi:lantibiotic biosynthesis protein
MNFKIREIIENVELNLKNEGIGLLSGLSGIAIFHYYCSLLVDEKYENNCIKDIEDAVDIINNGEDTGAFSAGIAGFGWILEFLKERKFLTQDDILLLDDLDDFLYKKMKAEFNDSHYDYLHGAMGYGMYFLKRIYKGNSSSYLSELVNHLDLLAEKNNDGSIKWLSSIDYEKGTKGYNISMSHGSSSIIAILSKIYNAGIETEKCRQLITGAVQYILKQELDRTSYNAFFPTMSLESDENILGSRLAWCYGDLGISMSLWQAGNNLNHPEWTEKALEVLLFSTSRKDLRRNLVVDAGLCHGTAGIGHIFYRMYWNTRRPEFKAAADYWFKKTLEMANHPDGLAGYKAWHSEKNGGWINETGLLEGISGIGLALLSYNNESEPSWDECLLLS